MARASSRPGRRNTAHHRPRRHILSPAIAAAENQRRRSPFPGRQPRIGGRARAGKGRSPGMDAGKAVWIEGFACQENPSIPSCPQRFWADFRRSPAVDRVFSCPRSARSRRSSNSCCGISDRGFRCVFSSSARSRGPSTCSASGGRWRGRPDAIRSSAVASATPGGARPGSPQTSSRSWRPSRWDPRQPDPRRQECAMARGDRSTSVAAAAFGWWRSNGSVMPGRWCS